jgi:phosphate transport system substrate-binding protein
MALLCLFLPSSAAIGQEAATPRLRIQATQGGKAILEQVIAQLAAQGTLGVETTVDVSPSVSILKDFCRGGLDSPDLIMTSHHLHATIIGGCEEHGVDDVIGVELGRTALILATHNESLVKSLTSRQIYLAVAREVPYKQEFARNASVRWADIDPSLPQLDIRFQLPTREEVPRQLFNAMVLENGCRAEASIKKIYGAEARTLKCVSARTDRVREVQQPKAAQALMSAPSGTIGVVSQLDIEASDGRLVGITLDGVAPSYDSIMRASYGNAASLWLFAKKRQVLTGNDAKINAAVRRIVDLTRSEAVAGPDGLLARNGIVPLPPKEREEQRGVDYMMPSSLHPENSKSWVSAAAAGIWTWAWGTTTPEAFTEQEAPQLDFTALMDIAGYKVSSIDSSFGLIPGASMTFGIAREMSSSDQEYLDRVLYLDARRRVGLVAVLQRRIVRAVLDAIEGGGLEVRNVTVTFLPLPNVSLSVSPKESE